MKKIIAILGLPGSGKTEAIKYLEKEYGWPNIYLGQITFDRMKKEGLKVNVTNERRIREKIRSELGMGAYAELSLPQIQKTLKKNSIVLIESLYSWEEYKILKEKYGNSFKTITIQASPEIRFQRLKHRSIRPIKTLKDFNSRNYSQIEKINQGGPIALTDYIVINDKDLKELHKELDKIITTIC
jgi:dephospho-CoA kinase